MSYCRLQYGLSIYVSRTQSFLQSRTVVTIDVDYYATHAKCKLTSRFIGRNLIMMFNDVAVNALLVGVLSVLNGF
jgi:hypothetical protein